jgi:predicted RNase H-like HicB family nuclease
MNDKRRTLDYFVSLPYKIELYPSKQGVVAAIPDLPGCIAQGATEVIALEMIAVAKVAWLEIALEGSVLIPEPMEGECAFNSRLNLQISRSLYQVLARLAEKAGVSPKRLATYLLSKSMENVDMRSF